MEEKADRGRGKCLILSLVFVFVFVFLLYLMYWQSMVGGKEGGGEGRLGEANALLFLPVVFLVFDIILFVLFSISYFLAHLFEERSKNNNVLSDMRFPHCSHPRSRILSSSIKIQFGQCPRMINAMLVFPGDGLLRCAKHTCKTIIIGMRSNINSCYNLS